MVFSKRGTHSLTMIGGCLNSFLFLLLPVPFPVHVPEGSSETHNIGSCMGSHDVIDQVKMLGDSTIRESDSRIEVISV